MPCKSGGQFFKRSVWHVAELLQFCERFRTAVIIKTKIHNVLKKSCKIKVSSFKMPEPDGYFQLEKDFLLTLAVEWWG